MKNISLQDYEEIIEVANLYLKSCKKGEGAIMMPAFHEAATINGNPIKTLFDGVDETGATNTEGRIDVLEVVNDIAVIRITMEDYAGANYVDFLVLQKGEEGWKILAKVFTEVK